MIVNQKSFIGKEDIKKRETTSRLTEQTCGQVPFKPYIYIYIYTHTTWWLALVPLLPKKLCRLAYKIRAQNWTKMVD